MSSQTTSTTTSSSRSNRLGLVLTGSWLFLKTAAEKTLGYGNPHISIKSETVLRFIQQYRDPKSLSKLSPGDDAASATSRLPSARSLEGLRKLMDKTSPAPRWVHKTDAEIPPLFDPSWAPLHAIWLYPPSYQQPGPSPDSPQKNPAFSHVHNGPTILYLHGGAYMAGSSRSHERLVSFIANASASRALVIDYSLAPEHRWPRQLQDALTAYAFLVDQCGVQPKNIVFMGDSAGGNLTLVTALALAILSLNSSNSSSSSTTTRTTSSTSSSSDPMSSNDVIQSLGLSSLPLPANDLLPGGLVLISPWVNMDTKTEESSRHSTWSTHAATDYLPSRESEVAGRLFLPVGADPQLSLHPLVSPVFAPAALLALLPPTLVSYGAMEQLTGQIEWFCRVFDQANPGKLHQKGYPGMPHVFHAFGGLLPYARQAIDEIGLFIKSTLQINPSSPPTSKL